MKKYSHLISLLLKIALIFTTFTYFTEPGLTVFSEHLTLRYLLENGYYLKVSVMITILVLNLLNILFSKNVSRLKYFELFLTVLWIVALLYDSYHARFVLDFPYYNVSAMSYQPFNNIVNNTVSWILYSIIISALSFFTYMITVSKSNHRN